MSCPVPVLFSVIFVPLQFSELLIKSGTIFFPLNTSCRLVCYFPTTQVENGKKSILTVCVYIFFLYHVVCVQLLLIFSQTPQPRLNHTHLLSLQLSIPNRLTGLWQQMLVDLLGAPHSSGACPAYISSERYLALAHLSQFLPPVSTSEEKKERPYKNFVFLLYLYQIHGLVLESLKETVSKYLKFT